MWFKPVFLLLSSLFLLSVSMWAGSKEPLKELAIFGFDNAGFNFGRSGCGNCDWFVVVDGVMGGRSSAELVTHEQSIVLTGDISLENRGGFASIRTPFENYDLSGFKQVKIRYRLSGQSFAFSLSNHQRFFMPRFKYVLPNTHGSWSEVVLSFDRFKKMRLSEEIGGGPRFSELETIIRLGLISNRKTAGPFVLEVDYIKFD